MFYRPADGHNLPHNPFLAIVAPRPIAWVSTRGPDGRENLAPYSFFNAVASSPPQVMFSSCSNSPDRPQGKDSLINIRDTGVFCINIVEHAMRDAMNLTSGPWPADKDEFVLAGIERAECETIACSRVAGAPAALECRMSQIVELEGQGNYAIFAEVVGVHMRDDCLRDGIFDVLSFQPLVRMGYHDYSRVTEAFPLIRPTK
ncbi:MAG: flavin reductase family protein [Paracoccaceae bacterium]